MAVSRRLMFVLLAAVTIVKSRGQAPPNTGLYFTLSGTVYLPGDTILITDIGSENANNKSDPGSSVLCVTTNVNARCCRNADGGSQGEWYLPNGTRLRYAPDTNFYRIRYTQQVRLYRRNGAISPTGVFTCAVLNNTMNHTATIRIATALPQLNVMLTGSGDTVAEGQNYTLTCAASGGGSMAYTYMWLKDGSVVSGQTSSTYYFFPLRMTDSGRYNCLVSLGYTNMTSEAVTITVVVVTTEEPSSPPQTTVAATIPPLTVKIVSSGGTLRAGQNHMLTCEASGGESMEYTYTWLKDGSVVSGQTSSTYFFSPLLVVHSGIYSCRVSVGSMAVTSEVVNITVERTDTQLYFTWRDNRYEAGDSILITDIGVHNSDAGPGDSLVCVTTDVNTQCCNDTGEGQWYFPNGSIVLRNIDTSQGTQIIRTGHANQVRLNFRAHQTSPTGEYTCVVPETGGSVNQTAGIRLVTVLPQLNVKLTGSGGTVTEGQNYVLTCTASGGGSMAYTYVWLRDGSVVSNQTSSTYSFSPLRVTDSGRYNCRVSVGSRNMTSEVVTITLVAVTTEEPSAAVTTEEPSSSPPQTTVATTIPPLTVRIASSGGTLRAGQNHVLTCEASGGGSMAYTYMWLKDGSVVSGKTSSKYSFSPLLVVHSGQYSCQVSVGSMTVTSGGVDITVENSYSPRHPESVIVTSTTPTGVTIQWMLTEPFNATRPETFVVLYGTRQNRLTRISTSMVIANATSQTHSIQLNSLDIGTQYYFQVQSRNRFRSVVSNVMDFITDDTMSGPVTDLQINSPDDFTLVISWRPPTTPNGNIISYTVRIENLRDGTTLRDIVDPSAVITSLTENGLVPGVPYRVSVVALNRAGQGSIALLTNFTKELEPTSAPKDIKVDRIHPTVMVVSWTPLTLSEARGFITSYTVFYSPQVSRRKQQEPSTMQKTVSEDFNQTFIDGLDPNTAYDVQVSASTKVGASALSEVIVAPVPPDTDGDGLLITLIVVIVVALVVVLIMGLIIILLVLLVLRMQRTMKTRNKELVELRTYNIADIYEIIDKEQDERRDETLSKTKSPSTTDTTNSQSKVEGLALSQCPAYVPVNSPSAARVGEDVEGSI